MLSNHYVGDCGALFAQKFDAPSLLTLVLEFVAPELEAALVGHRVEELVQSATVDALELILLAWDELPVAIDPCIYRWLAIAANKLARPDLLAECERAARQSLVKSRGRPIAFFTVQQESGSRSNRRVHHLVDFVRRDRDAAARLPHGVHRRSSAVYWSRPGGLWEVSATTAEPCVVLHPSRAVELVVEPAPGSPPRYRERALSNSERAALLDAASRAIVTDGLTVEVA